LREPILGNGGGKNPRIDHQVNGAVVGSTISDQAATCMAVVRIVDPDDVPSDQITKVEIIFDGGRVVATLDASDTTVEWTVELPSEDASYFYVRASTASNVPGEEGLTAWPASIWTGR
jgi:hypothetical protein